MKFITFVNVISFVKVQWENTFEVLKFFFLEVELLNLNFTKLINYWNS